MQTSDADFFSDSALSDPYPHYSALRAQGSVVFLDRIGVFALPRYQEVRNVLGDWETFTSAHGVALNEKTNELMVGSTLTVEPPVHEVMRSVLGRPLDPLALRGLAPAIHTEAEVLADKLVRQNRFDAVTELAWHLPLSIVAKLVGLPDEDRGRMLQWASAGFNALGPFNKRTLEALATAAELMSYDQQQMVREGLKQEGWAAALFHAADDGEISAAQAASMIRDYVGPSLDTTIAATANAIWLFAHHPAQWDAVRENPSLIPFCINEIVRLESPIQGFTRFVTKDVEIDGARLPEASRVWVMFGSANRDERKWAEPDRFDIRRNASDHVAFGHGTHRCVGANLARLELSAILTALASRVRRFHIQNATRAINNTIRSWAKLEVVVE